jgi:uncharacterized membrane protein
MNLLRYLRIRNPWYCRLEVLAAVALLAHVLVVWAIPYVIMAALSASRPAEERGTGPLLPPMTDATSRRVVMPSPDLLYALTAPSGRGLLLMRVLVGDYAAEREAVEAARRSLRCTPLG